MRLLLVLIILAVPAIANSTEVARYRVYNSEHSIARIVAGIGIGAVLGEGELGEVDVKLIKRPIIYIDGEPAEIWHAFFAMLTRGLPTVDRPQTGAAEGAAKAVA